jgi:hypothetical protein
MVHRIGGPAEAMRSTDRRENLRKASVAVRTDGRVVYHIANGCNGMTQREIRNGWQALLPGR